MTIALTGTGGLFTRWGEIGLLYNTLFESVKSTAPSPSSAWGASGPTIQDLGTAVNNIEAQYASAGQHLIDTLYQWRDGTRTAVTGRLTTLATLMSTTVRFQADADVGLPADTDIEALKELRRQMLASSDTIKGPTVTITPANGSPSPTGNPTITGCVIQKDGQPTNFVYNEVLDIVVQTDSLSGGATVGNESLALKGDVKVGYTDVNWPKGSGASITFNCNSASGSSNLAVNGNFDTFTTNTPGTWTVDVGTIGTHVLAEATDVYISGGKALKIVGDGSNLTTLSQAITGLKGGDVLALNAYVHVDAAAPAAGKLRFALVDSTNAVINDDKGTANSYTVDLTQTTLQTTYKATGAMTTTELDGASIAGGAGKIYFRIPSNVPTAVKLQIKVTTAITNAKNVFIDEVALVKATQAYGNGIAGGPYVAVFRGSTAMVQDDRFKLTVANNYGGAFSKLLWRVFDMPTLQIDLPNATSGNTISDSLLL